MALYVIMQGECPGYGIQYSMGVACSSTTGDSQHSHSGMVVMYILNLPNETQRNRNSPNISRACLQQMPRSNEGVRFTITCDVLLK